MSFELIGQSVQYSFYNPKYGEDGMKSRIYRNVKSDASSAGLAQVGKALAKLQGDELVTATIIQKQAVPLATEDK